MRGLKIKEYEIIMPGKCNNNCLCCQDLKPNIEPPDDLFTKIIITGPEPTIQPGFFRLLEQLRKYTRTVLITNGRMFAYEGFIGKLLEYRITEYQIKLYSIKKEIHEKITRTKGSHEQTLQGIENIRKQKVLRDTIRSRKIREMVRKPVLSIIIPVLEENIGFIEETVEKINNNEINYFVLEFKENARLAITEQVMERIKKIIHNMESQKSLVLIKGLPLCVYKEDMLNSYEFYSGEKSENHLCPGCDLKSVCPGTNPHVKIPKKEVQDNKINAMLLGGEEY